jgi:hypothetical protein
VTLDDDDDDDGDDERFGAASRGRRRLQLLALKGVLRHPKSSFDRKGKREYIEKRRVECPWRIYHKKNNMD